MISIDRLCYQSKLRYENAQSKFIYAMLTLVICLLSRSIAAAVLALAVNHVMTVKKGGVPARQYLHFMMIPLVFLLLSSMAIVINLSSAPMDLFAISIGRLYLTGSWDGLFYALQLVLTSLSAVSSLYFLSMTTPMPDILNVLRQLHCPKLLIELMLLIYRYIFILLETAHAIRISQHSRLGYRNYRLSLKSFGMLGSSLMIRAVNRSKVLYDAMEARCYDGTIQVLNETIPPRKGTLLKIIIFECLLLLIAVGGRLI